MATTVQAATLLCWLPALAGGATATGPESRPTCASQSPDPTAPPLGRLSHCCFSPAAASCATAADCALAGECVEGRCACDAGWKDPPGGGTPCSAFDLLPADPAQPGYRNESWPSWGGHPVQWPKAEGGDGLWHLFTPQFANGCEVDEWIHNSFVVHAVGDSPTGPWRHHDVSIPVWSHGSQAVINPVDGTWLLFFVGGWHYPPTQWASCRPHNHTVPWPVEPPGPGLPAVGDCGPKQNAGCGIRVATSPSPFGPWAISDVKFAEDARPSAKSLTCARSDPAPSILENGTTFLAFGSGGCVGGLETIGVARAESWNSTFRFTSPTGAAIAETSQFSCPTGQLAEDPHLFRNERGWHLIAHG